MEVLKVSSRSNPNSVAGAMAGVIRQAGAVEVQVVGAGALNQAIKALAIARGYVAASGVDLVCVPTFADIDIDGERRTAIRLAIEDREGRLPEAFVDLTGAVPRAGSHDPASNGQASSNGHRPDPAGRHEPAGHRADSRSTDSRSTDSGGIDAAGALLSFDGHTGAAGNGVGNGRWDRS